LINQNIKKTEESEIDFMRQFQRLPRHIGIIPDGNRRWAQGQGMNKEAGYDYGIDPGFELYKECIALGIQEMTFYGFTVDNTKRPSAQTKAFQKACVDAVMQISQCDANLLIVGNTESALFPKELLPYTKRVRLGKGLMNVNFLVNYGWDWDLSLSRNFEERKNKDSFSKKIASADISRIDLIIRWGGRRRLSGFLPIQSIYADFYVLDALWPDYKPEHLYEALEWFQKQDVTLGG
jgi:undecaprenyl diphosphate synthase